LALSLSRRESDDLGDEKLNIILSDSPSLQKMVILECNDMKSENVKSMCLGYLKQYGWNSKDLKICAPNVHSLSLWGELDFEDYMIEDRSCTCLERVELGFQLKLENLVENLGKWELPGTFHLLRSSPELEPLTLEVTSSSYVYVSACNFSQFVLSIHLSFYCV